MTRKSSAHLLVVTAFIFCFNPAFSVRVLGLFPYPGESHFHFMKPIMQELAAHGHNVTVVSHFPDPHPPPNYSDLPLTGMSKTSNSVDLNVSSTL